VALLALFALNSPAQVATAAVAGPYVFDWKGGDTAPVTWTGQGGWDVLVHKRGPDGTDMVPMLAQHGANCGPPPASHVISSLDDGVFICHNHVMTSIVDKGFGAIVLTPDHMADFSAGETVIGFQTTTQHFNARDWIDMWVTPFADNVTTPLNDAVDVQGPPRNAIRVRMCECFDGQTTFRASVISNFVETALPQASGRPAESVVAESSVTRTPFELHLSQNHVRFGMPQQNLWWVDTGVNLPFNRGVVQVIDHSYDSCKDQPTDLAHPCASGDTWHFSHFTMSSAVPFTLLNGDDRYLGQLFQSNTVHFPAPAPANAFLRFEAMGSNIEWSSDGGRTFHAANRQAVIGDHGTIHEEHFSPYFTPIPAGTTSVVLRGQSGWYGKWTVRDPSIWASEYSGPVNQPPPPASAPPPAAKTPPAPQGSPATGNQGESGEHRSKASPKPVMRLGGVDLSGAVRTAEPFVPVALLIVALGTGIIVGYGWRRRRKPNG